MAPCSSIHTPSDYPGRSGAHLADRPGHRLPSLAKFLAQSTRTSPPIFIWTIWGNGHFHHLPNHLLELCVARTINNAFYNELGSDWLHRTDHPIALLRAENSVRNPWILQVLNGKFKSFLDVGCGGGLLANFMAQNGYKTTGIDLSESSLAIAKKTDQTGTVNYLAANATSLPFLNHSFDAVAAMDLLEHVEDPASVIREASRVLKPGGLFFFHTFNRNILSYLLVIQGVERIVPNAPKNMHVYPLFIKPKELISHCKNANLKVVDLRGLTPQIFSKAALKIAITRNVPPDFKFSFSKSLLTGYCGYAIKE